MSELRRMSEGANLRDFDRAVLRSASSDRPSRSARLAAQTVLGIGVAAGAAAATSTSAAAVVSGGKVAGLAGLSGLAKVALSALVIATALATPLAIRSISTPRESPGTPRPATPTRVDPAVRAPISPVAQVAPAPAEPASIPIDALPTAMAPPAPVRSAVTPAPTPAVALPTSASKPSSPTRLGEEVSLIERARTALAGGDATAALATLDVYDKQFSAGALAPEAQALRAIALDTKRDQNGTRAP